MQLIKLILSSSKASLIYHDYNKLLPKLTKYYLSVFILVKLLFQIKF
jgi:hypothetical protein